MTHLIPSNDLFIFPYNYFEHQLDAKFSAAESTSTAPLYREEPLPFCTFTLINSTHSQIYTAFYLPRQMRRQTALTFVCGG